MEIIVKVEKRVKIKTLQVRAGVRYWEDATINGFQDEDGSIIPCKEGDCWCPEIDLETGRILNWEQGKEADIHFKVSDQCSWTLFDDRGEEVYSVQNEYVPSTLCPEGNGYGDYIIMKVNDLGQIKNWKVNLSDFQPDLYD